MNFRAKRIDGGKLIEGWLQICGLTNKIAHILPKTCKTCQLCTHIATTPLEEGGYVEVDIDTIEVEFSGIWFTEKDIDVMVGVMKGLSTGLLRE